MRKQNSCGAEAGGRATEARVNELSAALEMAQAMYDAEMRKNKRREAATGNGQTSANGALSGRGMLGGDFSSTVRMYEEDLKKLHDEKKELLLFKAHAMKAQHEMEGSLARTQRRLAVSEEVRTSLELKLQRASLKADRGRGAIDASAPAECSDVAKLHSSSTDARLQAANEAIAVLKARVLKFDGRMKSANASLATWKERAQRYHGQMKRMAEKDARRRRRKKQAKVRNADPPLAKENDESLHNSSTPSTKGKGATLGSSNNGGGETRSPGKISPPRPLGGTLKEAGENCDAGAPTTTSPREGNLKEDGGNIRMLDSDSTPLPRASGRADRTSISKEPKKVNGDSDCLFEKIVKKAEALDVQSAAARSPLGAITADNVVGGRISGDAHLQGEAPGDCAQQ